MSLLDHYPQRDGMFTIRESTVLIADRYRNRAVMLDALGCQIWLRIDGHTTVRAIAHDIAGVTGRPVEAMEVETSVMAGVLLSEGLLYLTSEPVDPPYHVAIPREDQDVKRAHQSLIDEGWITETGGE